MSSSVSDDPTEWGGGRSLADANEVPDRIARFVVVEKIGMGGMGVVLMAYDPKLDRRVAIKLVHPSRTSDPEAQDRMLREAQALAKLSHPNVVQIYDVGTHADQVYLAMEFIDGDTLESWLRREPRPGWREIVDMFVAAGEGLAAAHAAGLVHRDFKPHNALVGKDGRVRVLDFGLVRVHRLEDVQLRTETTPEPASAGWHTRTGDVLGTPAFMAPEQFLGEPGDERTDQYNFCASLFRGLWDVRPHPGDNLREIMDAALAGTIVARPSDSDVPAEIEAAVLRGLAREPADRYPSLAELLAVLRGRPTRGRWLPWTIAAAIGVAAIAVIVTSGDDGPPALERCLAASQAARNGWTEQRADIERAFAATKLGYASDSFARLDTHVDSWLAQWQASHEQACRAAHGTATQTQAMLDVRVACLERARTQLDATADVLATADAAVVRRTQQLADSLPDVSRCDDVEALVAAVPPPADEASRAAVAAVRERVAKSTALDRAGRFADAEAEARKALEDAKGVDYPPVAIEATRQLAEAQASLGEVADSETNMRAAYWGALAERLDDVAYGAAWRMVEIAGVTGQKFEEAEWWWQSADALRRRTGADASAEGGLIALHATLKQLKGEYDEALALSDQALALIESPRLRLKVMNDRGDLFSRMGRFDDADAAFADAYAKSVEMYGAKHPDSTLPLANRGMIALQREDYPRAVELIEQAIEVLEPAVAQGNPHLASMHNMLGVAAENQKQYAEARKQYARALAIREQSLGPEHSEVAMIHGNLGRLAWAERKNEEAIAEFTQAVAIFERTLGPEHPNLATALSGLGTTYWEMRRFDDAIPPLERALAIHSRNGIDPFLLARTQFLLARVLWDHGDHKRATGLARQAHVMLVKPEAPSEPRNAIAAWSEQIGLDLEE